jgi:hypothetical protein
METGSRRNRKVIYRAPMLSFIRAPLPSSPAMWLAPIACWLACASSEVPAQQARYSYDLPGNLVAVNTTNLLAASSIAQPQSQLLETNAPVSLSVVASGLGLTYQWYSNGIPIAGATNDTLLFLNLASSHFANYTVVLSNASGVVTSTPAALWFDSNANGLPDWWEVKYFGNLDQTADGYRTGTLLKF